MMADDTMTTADALQVLACCGHAHLDLNTDPGDVTREQIDDALDHLTGLGAVNSITIHKTRQHVRAMSTSDWIRLHLDDGRNVYVSRCWHAGKRLDLYWEPDTNTDTEETP